MNPGMDHSMNHRANCLLNHRVSRRSERVRQACALSVAILGLALALGGCCAGSRALSDFAVTLPEATGPVDSGMRPADLMPGQAISMDVTIYRDSSDEPTVAKRTIERDRQGWLDVIKGVQTTRYVLTDDRVVAVAWERSERDGVEVRYDPPMPWLAAAMADGQASTPNAVKVTIYTLDGKSIRDQGTCNVTIEPMQATRVGGQSAALLRHQRHFDLKWADSTVTVDVLLMPGQGDVRQIIREQTTALGMFTTNRTWGWMRGR